MTPVAIAFAFAAAVVFGIAAVTQHRAVRRAVAPSRRRLTLRQVAVLIADAGWRRGFGLMALGTGLHVAALSLAPISLTQPINVLAVPTTILVAAMIGRHRPARSLLCAAAAVVVGVAGFVAVLSGGSAGTLPTPAVLGIAAAAVIAATGALHGSARLVTRGAHRGAVPMPGGGVPGGGVPGGGVPGGGVPGGGVPGGGSPGGGSPGRAAPGRGAPGRGAPGWVAPVLLAIAGAVNFGVASSIFRLLAQDLSHARALPVLAAAALVCAVPVAMAVGSWSIHQAYAAGAAAGVTATSALTDPLVAITVGITVLGETHQVTPGPLAVLILAAVLAGAGIVHLARHEDETPDPSPTVDAVAQRTNHAHPARR